MSAHAAGRTDGPIELAVLGIGVWADRLPGWAVARGVLRGELPLPDAVARPPGSALLPPAERRRAPTTVALALTVAEQACAHAALAPAGLPSVFVSMHGDLETTDYLCRVLAASPANLSPTRFHNSVHNAPAGYWSIGTGCMRPSIAMSGGPWSFGTGLLEAATQAACEHEPVLLVAYDMPACGPLAAMAPSVGALAIALVLAPAGFDGRRLQLRLGALRQPSERMEPCRGNPMSCGLALLRALGGDTAQQVELALSASSSVYVTLHAT